MSSRRFSLFTLVPYCVCGFSAEARPPVGLIRPPLMDNYRFCDPSDPNSCPSGKFCRIPNGICDSADVLGVCTTIPLGCPDNIDPVCGCDGVTYFNLCEALAASMSILHVGPCEQVCGGIAGIPCDKGEFCKLPTGHCCCDHQGVCVPIPEACPAVWDPVCGCDGMTYGNECEAEMAGVSVDHDGPCGQLCGGFAGIPCDDPNEFCKTAPGECCCDFFGICTPFPQGCPDVWDPVCGCDGMTYSNECDADAAGVSVDHVGECEE